MKSTAVLLVCFAIPAIPACKRADKTAKSDKDGKPDPAAAADQGAGTPPALSDLDAPRVDATAKTVAAKSAPPPPEVIWVQSSGTLDVATPVPPWTGELPAERGEVAHADGIAEIVLSAETHMASAISVPASSALTRLEHPDPAAAALPPALHLPVATPTTLPAMSVLAPLVIAAANAPAVALAQVLVRVGGGLGVSQGGKLAVYFVGYEPAPVTPTTVMQETSWLELHADAAGAHVIVVPSGDEQVVPWKPGTVDHSVDRAGVAAAFAKLRAAGNTSDEVDVLVRGDTTAQQLVDLLGALDAVPELAVSIGESPSTPAERIANIKKAAAAAPAQAAGSAAPYGDLDKNVIRGVINQHLQAIRHCYETALLANPKLEGTVTASFFIAPDGKVAASSASGVDAGVATCVADAIKTLVFPAPTGGGGVQVNYPFVFRAAK